MTEFSVTILGSSSATPTTSRNPTSQLVNINHKLVLIDCGEGTQVQLRKMKVKLNRINHIFISHLHGDHFFGLIGLISTLHLYGRSEPLIVYGPQGLEDIINGQLNASQTQLVFPLNFVTIASGSYEILLEESTFTVSAFPLEHRIVTSGFIVKEKPSLLKIRKAIVEKLEIPFVDIQKIKSGADYLTPEGRLIPNSELTYPSVSPRTYSYCSDTRFSHSYIPFIKGSDLLYHEATFMDDLKETAYEKYHSTAREAATAALLAEAGKLVLGHYSARYTDLQPLLGEAMAVFPNTILSYDGQTIDVGNPKA